MSKPRSAAAREVHGGGPGTSIAHTALAALLALAGIAYVVYYAFWVLDDGEPVALAELGGWNWLIGFGVFFVGLTLAASRRTPLGRGRGVVVGMLGCFLLGLLWIVVYYITSQEQNIPLLRELGNYNLVVGMAFMAVGFVYATKWE